MSREIRAALRVYKMVAELHRRGYERLRIVPGMSPSGCYYRSSVTSADNVFADHGALAVDWDRVAINTSGNGSRLFQWPDAPGARIATLARIFFERYPDIAARGFGPDPEYVRWFALALASMERGTPPVACDDDAQPHRRRPRWMPTLSDDASRLPMPPPGTNVRRYYAEREGRERAAAWSALVEFPSDDRDERAGGSDEVERGAGSVVTAWSYRPILDLRTCHTSDVRAMYDPCVEDDTTSDDALRLETLLEKAGYKSTRFDATRRFIMFTGRTRDWTLSLTLGNGWFSMTTYVCEIPEPSGVRAELLDVAMTANHAMSLTKFVKSWGLVMELEYRDEHLTGEVVRNLVGLALENLEEWYPKLFRVVSGDAALAQIAADGTSPTTNAFRNG